MTFKSDYRRGRTCVSAIHIHLVFVTKYRKRVFTSAALDIVKEVMHKVCDDFGVELAAFEGEDNHVHVLVNYPPQLNNFAGYLQMFVPSSRPS